MSKTAETGSFEAVDEEEDEAGVGVPGVAEASLAAASAFALSLEAEANAASSVDKSMGKSLAVDSVAVDDDGVAAAEFAAIRAEAAAAR